MGIAKESTKDYYEMVIILHKHTFLYHSDDINIIFKDSYIKRC